MLFGHRHPKYAEDQEKRKAAMASRAAQ